MPKSKTKQLGFIKELLIKAGALFDITGPLVGGLWIAISFIPPLVAFITHGAVPAETLVGALLCSELALILPREGVPFLSWLSDVYGLEKNANANTKTANRLRKLQLFFALIALLMNALDYLQTLSTTIAKFWHIAEPFIAGLANNFAIVILVKVCAFAPYVSVIAGTIGVVYYGYQAVTAAKRLAKARQRLDALENEETKGYDRLYTELHTPGATVKGLHDATLNEGFKQYVINRHKYEADIRQHTAARNTGILFASIAAAGILIALIAIAIAFPPVGGALLGAVTVAVAAKIAIAAACFLIAAVITGFYINKGIQTRKEKAIINSNNHIINKQLAHLNSKELANTPEPRIRPEIPPYIRLYQPVKVARRGMFRPKPAKKQKKLGEDTTALDNAALNSSHGRGD